MILINFIFASSKKNDYLVIYIVKDIFIDIKNDKIIQSFHNMKNCRGQWYKFSYMAPPLFKNLGSVTYYTKKNCEYY